MAAIIKAFHRKISLSVLPTEYYFPFKSLYKTLVMQNTLDMGAVVELTQLSKSKQDYDTHINYIIQGYTIILRKLEQGEDDMRKNKSERIVKITAYTYCYVIAALHFTITNHILPVVTDKCVHTANDVDEASECKYCTIEYRKELETKVVFAYLKLLMPSKKKLSEILEIIKHKLQYLIKEQTGEDLTKKTKKYKNRVRQDVDAEEKKDSSGESDDSSTESTHFSFSTMLLIKTLLVFHNDL